MKAAILGSLHLFLRPQATGVRYISMNIYHVLRNAGYEVDFIGNDCLLRPADQTFPYPHHTYSRFGFTATALADNFHIVDLVVDMSMVSRLRSYVMLQRSRKRLRDVPVGYDVEAVDINLYDAIFVAAPWLSYLDARRAKGDVFLIYHDSTPEVQRFLKQRSSGLAFLSFQAGETALRDYKKILCVSEATAAQFKACYQAAESFDANKVEAIPQTVLPAFLADTPRFETRENAIVLANPFDERKCPLEAAEVVNRVGSAERIYIFGDIRCRVSLAQRFFRRLRKDIPVLWYRRASTRTVVDMFSRSKVLVFPSHTEGIGIPIIEAQVRGCRVMVRDRSPMRDLILDGSALMTGDAVRDAGTIETMMSEVFDVDQLMAAARRKYDIDVFGERIRRLVGEGSRHARPA